MKPDRKYILIPEYRGLFAMRECFGPPRGPLAMPTPTPIPVIGKLLQQSGDDALTIYEVLFDRKANKTIAPPVQLTKENYHLPYHTIAGSPEQAPKSGVMEKVAEHVVEPKIVTPEPPVEEVIEKVPVVEEDPEVIVDESVTPEVEEPTAETQEVQPTNTEVPEQEETIFVTGMTADPVGDEVISDTDIVTPVEAATVTTTASVIANPYAGMTKAQRKAARKAAAEAEVTQTESTEDPAE